MAKVSITPAASLSPVECIASRSRRNCRHSSEGHSRGAAVGSAAWGGGAPASDWRSWELMAIWGAKMKMKNQNWPAFGAGVLSGG